MVGWVKDKARETMTDVQTRGYSVVLASQWLICSRINKETIWPTVTGHSPLILVKLVPY